MKKAIIATASVCAISLLLTIGLGIGSAFTMANAAETGELERSIQAYLDKYDHWFGNIGWSINGWGDSRTEVKTQGVDFSLTENSTLQINANVADIIVKPGDSSRAVMHVYSSNYSFNADMYSLEAVQSEADKNSVTIQLNEPQTHHARVVLEVYVNPKALAGCNITSLKVGDIKLYDLELGNAELNVNVGETDIQNCTVSGTIDVKGGTGDFDMQSTSAQNITVDLNVGDIKVTDITAQTLTLATKTGDIDAQRLAIKNSCQLSTNVGEIHLSPQTTPGYRLEYSIKVGEFSDSVTDNTYTGNAKRNGTVSVGDGSIPIKASTKTGDITLYQPY